VLHHFVTFAALAPAARRKYGSALTTITAIATPGIRRAAAGGIFLSLVTALSIFLSVIAIFVPDLSEFSQGN
jgi:hypothetical protein